MSKLREAAQALLDAYVADTNWMIPYWDALSDALQEDALVRLSNTHQQLDEALEYELIGTIDGTYNGRWMLAAFAENAAAVWPDGTAVYVRRGQE
jgi:membrane-associated HD superfamily phosphohydrolase